MSKLDEKKNRVTPASRGQWLAVFSMALMGAALLIASLKLPLWHIRLEAPQYRGEEALRVAVYPNAMRGDLNELATLDKYIGVHIPPTLPQFKWLPAALVSAAVLGLIACCFGRSIRSSALFVIPIVLAMALGVAAVQANLQMRNIGHHRDRKTVLVGVQDFTPPFLGRTKIAQFEVSSGLGWGAWFIGGAMALQIAGAFLSRYRASSAVSSACISSANALPPFKSVPLLHQS